VEADMSYNVLIGMRTLNQLDILTSTPHMAKKFPTLNGTIIRIKADLKEARQCYIQSLKVNPYTLETVGERARSNEAGSPILYVIS